ncbi:MAG: MSHA biogenesis protein MshD [Moraxellaceae bacterium]|nr:MAG: MSHA biogenesis protein MshD [Moraxellaceae bacterium]
MELVITIVVISIALVAMVGAFSGSMSRSADPMWRNKTIKLAQLYLDEIHSKRYDENTPIGGVPAAAVPTSCSSLGPEAGETRATFDDVDDYDGLSGSPPTGVNGALHSSYDNYVVTITVSCDGTAASVNGNQHAKKIKVSITPPAEGTMDFFVYKGNY